VKGLQFILNRHQLSRRSQPIIPICIFKFPYLRWVIPTSPAAFLPLQIMPSVESNVKIAPGALRTITFDISHVRYYCRVSFSASITVHAASRLFLACLVHKCHRPVLDLLPRLLDFKRQLVHVLQE